MDRSWLSYYSYSGYIYYASSDLVREDESLEVSRLIYRDLIANIVVETYYLRWFRECKAF